MRRCSIAGCEKPSRKRGFCTLHYQRWRRHGDPEKCLKAISPRGEPQAYLRDVVLHFGGNECLFWPYAKLVDGRGTIERDGRTQYVHRVVCEAIHGAPPSSIHQAAHSCGNGNLACCAPRHLRWATPKENMADTRAHGTLAIGERCGTAKLTEAAVREIRLLASGLSQKAIADRFGVGPAAIFRVVRSQTWTHVE